ncbi:MAG: hypothetical protein RLZZ450_7055 [Pseudomonadota bacterium]
MHLHVIAVGKIKERGLRELIDDYAKRIGRYGTYHEVELKDAAADEVEERFRKAIPARSRVYALEVEGRAVSSHDLAQLVGKAEDTSIMNLVFLIGGSYGLPQATSKAADAQLSLSKLILPHRLARLLLVEQLYRAFTILRNEPYSH